MKPHHAFFLATGALTVGLLAIQPGAWSPPTPSAGSSLTHSTAQTAPAVPEGWESTGTDGVFYRNCTDSCPTDGVIGDQSYWLYEFWCRDRSCDIYVKGNIYNAAGQSIGWTNDTGSGMQGDKVVITMSTHMDGAQKLGLDEINIR